MRTFRNEAPVQNGHLVQRRYDYYGDDTVKITYTLKYILEFDGVDDYLLVTHSSGINPSSNITVEWYGKSNTDTWNSYGMLVSKRDAYILHPEEGTKEIRFHILGETFAGVTSVKDITSPRHYVGTYDGTDIKIYEDGALMSTVNSPGVIAADTGDLYIGQDDGFGNDRVFNGQMAIVRIWSRTLNDDEIQNLYIQRQARTVTGLDTSLELNLVMSDGKGTSVTDSSGNGNHGTISGATWVGRDSGALF